MRFLIDECLHTSLVGVAERHGHACHHVNWLGLSGAADFRRLYARRELHAGLAIIVPQVEPARQRALFDAMLAMLGTNATLVNEAIEVG